MEKVLRLICVFHRLYYMVLLIVVIVIHTIQNYVIWRKRNMNASSILHAIVYYQLRGCASIKKVLKTTGTMPEQEYFYLDRVQPITLLDFLLVEVLTLCT